MDIEHARTFLAIAETGSFVEAAKRVNVTQSTVSARIRVLENRLGKILFDRGKSGASLTPAGIQFHKHAQAMVRVWQHARLEIALPEGHQDSLTVGGQYSLWENYLIGWLARMRAQAPAIAVRARMGFSDALMQGLIDGTIDLGVMYTPQRRPGIEVELLFEDRLVLVTGGPVFARIPGGNYVMIDWGPEFRADHALNYPEISVPGTQLELGSLSVQYLIEAKASGYVPLRIARTYLDQGVLHRVAGAPAFSYPAYAAYSADADQRLMSAALAELKVSAKSVNSP